MVYLVFVRTCEITNCHQETATIIQPDQTKYQTDFCQIALIKQHLPDSIIIVNGHLESPKHIHTLYVCECISTILHSQTNYIRNRITVNVNYAEITYIENVN